MKPFLILVMVGLGVSVNSYATELRKIEIPFVVQTGVCSHSITLEFKSFPDVELFLHDPGEGHYVKNSENRRYAVTAIKVDDAVNPYRLMISRLGPFPRYVPEARPPSCSNDQVTLLIRD